MRYDTPIFFQKLTRGEYNQKTGNYLPDTVEETQRFASVNDTQDEKKMLVYGSVKIKSKTAHIQGHYTGVLDYIRIGSDVYRVDNRRVLKQKETFILSEVQ